VCEIKALCIGLIKLGLAIAVVAGAYGLTVSAGDLPGGVPGHEADALASAHESDVSGVSLAYERVEIPEAGLALEVPIGWQQLDEEPAWSPTGDGERRIGVSWYHLLSAIRPEAVLLPVGGHIAESTPIVLDWGSGRQYLVKHYGPGVAGAGAGVPASSVELHTIIVVADGQTQWAYDLHAVAPTEEELAAEKPILDTMLESMHLTTPLAVGTSQ
jgi:hypothetical protein